MSVNRLILIFVGLVTTSGLVLSILSLRNISTNDSKLEKKLQDLNTKVDNIQSKLTQKPSSLVGNPALEKLIETIKSRQSVTESTNSAVLGKTQSFGYITLNDPKWEGTKIYKEKSYSSKVIANAKYGQLYLYQKKEGNWYFILIPENDSGWVNARFFKEVNNLP